jgi:hypothetical protein
MNTQGWIPVRPLPEEQHRYRVLVYEVEQGESTEVAEYNTQAPDAASAVLGYAMEIVEASS